MRQEGIGFEALDNGFVSCDNPQRLQAICDGLSADKTEALLQKWLRLLPHPFLPFDQEAGYTYDLSIWQAELASDDGVDFIAGNDRPGVVRISGMARKTLE